MGTTTLIDYIYRLRGSRNTKKYKITNKNGENEGTIKSTKNSIAPARIAVRLIFQHIHSKASSASKFFLLSPLFVHRSFP
jgi:hypothetical protein